MFDFSFLFHLCFHLIRRHPAPAEQLKFPL
jgi:hypothetical protein